MAIALYATGPNGAFGLGGKLPFKCKKDMERFSAITKAHGSLAMGKATYDSVGPLNGRVIYVVTTNQELINQMWHDNGDHMVKYVSLETALRSTEIFAGGAKLLTAVWPSIHKVCKSTIFDTSIGDMDCDVRFMPDLSDFGLIHSESHDDHYFEILVRK